jgi:hypothetical protein
MSEETYLRSIVTNHCRALGVEKAAEFFDVTQALVRQWLAGSKCPSLAAVEKVFVVPSGPPAEAGWEGREVFLALPFYKTTNPLTLFSVLAVWDRQKFRAGMKFNDAFIAHARNSLAHDFLGTGVPWCWWVDDDVVAPMGSASWFNTFTGSNLPDQYAGLHTPTRLRSHGKSIVSGLYVGRETGGRAMYAEALANDAENQYAHAGPYDTIKQTEFAGMGCMLTSRQVFLDIQAKFPHLEAQRKEDNGQFHFFSNSSDALQSAIPELRSKIEAAGVEVKGGTADVALRILEDAVRQIDDAVARNRAESAHRQSEDRTFCVRAAAAGHLTYVDFAVCCGHVGPHVYHIRNTS